MVCVPDAVSPVSLLPAVNVTTTLSPTFAVLPLVGETDVTENVGAVVSKLLVTDCAEKFCNEFPFASSTEPDDCVYAIVIVSLSEIVAPVIPSVMVVPETETIEPIEPPDTPPSVKSPADAELLETD